MSLSLLACLLSALLAPSTQEEPGPSTIPVLVVTGANNHDWEWTSEELVTLLEETGRFAVEVTREPSVFLADPAKLRPFQVLVLDYNGPRWGEEAEQSFLAAVRGGTGVAVIHAADNAFPGWTEYEKLVGLLWREGAGHGRFHPFDVRIVDRDHPLTRDLPDLRGHPDELYHRLVSLHDVQPRVLATAFSSQESGGTGQDEPMLTVGRYGRGRVFHTPLGHVWRGQEATRASWKDPAFRNLVARGVEWAATGVVTLGPSWGMRMTPEEAAAGFLWLFDGSTTAGWRGFRKDGFPEQGWRVEEGALYHQAGQGGGDIVTTSTWRNFDLRLEWKIAPGGNSGIMYRVGEEGMAPWQTGPEYQILDDLSHHDGQRPETSAAALYALYAPEGKEPVRAEEWHAARILLRGSHVEHWLDGRQVVSAEIGSEDWLARVAASKFAEMPGFGSLAEGRLDLQDHGDDVWFRNIRILDLAPLPPPVTLFDGRSLSGWTGFHMEDAATEDVWRVEDGVLICRGTPSGYLRTEASFTNFILDLEWRWDPVSKEAGNSGVLLRMTGEDKVWPRSLEAQLQSGSAGDFWLIDSFPMRPDPRRWRGRNVRKLGYAENPVGEWNHYRIIVNHGHVVLMVNGRMVNEGWDAEEISGHICLQSEGAEIHFRDIRLQPLP